jgi:hypothetical protein
MRPPRVHAKPACTATPAGCPCDVARLLPAPTASLRAWS